MSSNDARTQTAAICWALDLDDSLLLALDSEEEAIENWLVAEYECGCVAIIHRPEITNG